MPIIEQIRRDRRKPESCFLSKFSANRTSQAGEDGILAKLFEIIAVESRWCVEFGAWDGKKYSNTYELIAGQGWSGVLIEGSDEKFAELLKTYGGNDRAVCVNGMVQPGKGEDSLEGHLSRTPLPKRFDLLSIDVDGNDYHIWKSMETYEPRVVVIEFNPTIPGDIVFVQDANVAINQGCSLRALVELGKGKGYELACATKLNGIFVNREEFGKLGIADNDIDAMFQPRFDAKFFQGYDGTLYTFGLSKLVWRGGLPIAPDALQILKPEDRFYKGSPLRRRAPTAPTQASVARRRDWKRPEAALDGIMESAYFDLTRSAAEAAAHRHRQAIGGLWDAVGKLQFRFLRERGLRPQHRLLDVGCGALRCGVRFVRYLNPGNYYGVDMNQPFLDAGYDIELKAAGLVDRLPRSNLLCDDMFDVARLGVEFDFAIAQSLFTHLTFNRIRQCLQRVVRVMKPGSAFYATFFELPEGAPADLPLRHQPGDKMSYDVSDPYHYSVADFEHAIRGLPWSLEYIGDWKHPRAQRMLEFRRLGE